VFEVTRGGIRLAVYDLGGTGPAVLLVHGLAGYSREWDASADLLRDYYRVFALDQRGHGASERVPDDLSRAAFVEDCSEAIRTIGLGAVTLVGQSMGANTAMLVAASQPDLVRSLVVIEGSPDGPETHDPDPEIATSIRKGLGGWPVPFADEQAAHAFFRSRHFDPEVWTAGLKHRTDGLWPRWDLDVMVACMVDLGSRNYWTQWQSVRCPTLIVMGEHGMFASGHGDEIAARLPGASLIVVPGAGHDVHLDAPAEWVAALLDSPAR
jgi:pimeloyl-ACP methyl ester carboxylesterase